MAITEVVFPDAVVPCRTAAPKLGHIVSTTALPVGRDHQCQVDDVDGRPVLRLSSASKVDPDKEASARLVIAQSRSSALQCSLAAALLADLAAEPPALSNGDKGENVVSSELNIVQTVFLSLLLPFGAHVHLLDVGHDPVAAIGSLDVNCTDLSSETQKEHSINKLFSLK